MGNGKRLFAQLDNAFLHLVRHLVGHQQVVGNKSWQYLEIRSKTRKLPQSPSTSLSTRISSAIQNEESNIKKIVDEDASC